MAPQKRKRSHDDLIESTAQSAKPQSQSQSQEPIRRGTRSNPQGLSNEEKHHLRSGRVRANTTEKLAVAKLLPERVRGKKDDAPMTATAPPVEVPVKQTRHSKHIPSLTEPSKENIQPSAQAPTDAAAKAPLKSVLPSHNASSQSTIPPPKSSSSRSLPGGRPPPKPPAQQQQQQQRPLNQIPSSSAAAVATATALATPKRTLGEKPLKPPPTPRSDRNIDKVVLGNICFKAWYPSYYGKEVLGDVSGNAGGGKDIGGARMGGGKRDPPMLDRLYVCPCCFKYSKELVSWWEHVWCCERKGEVPGRKVYTHPKGTGVKRVKSTAVDAPPAARGKGKKKVGLEASATERIDEEGEWSIWEVDGEEERLFCQNLSLFAKLFLDNKSVFFDVSGFNYFLLVYTPPPPPPPTAPQRSGAAAQTPASSSAANSDQQNPAAPPTPPSQPPPPPPPRPQIVGFFSKEKMSWDNNNLACILVFPPWQRKGLGSILMGVSYEISRREGILGGPEKPISDLGRKGYKRFWAGEIARWLLGLEVPPPKPKKPSSSSSSGAKGGEDRDGDGDEDMEDDEEGEEESGEKNNVGGAREGRREAEEIAVVDIQVCSKATWIVPEDCLLVLREMGVVEEADPGSGSGPGPGASPVAAATSVAAAANASRDTPADADADAEEKPASSSREVKLVPRVRVDKAAVRKWVLANKIGLERTCDPGGFLEGYAVKKAADGDVDGGE